MNNPNDKTEAPKKIDVREHVDKNVNLYTVFGILNALTIYSTTITNSPNIVSWLTFSFLTLTIILLYTIKMSVDNDTSTFLLKIYLLLIDCATLALLIYWAVQFRPNRNFFFFMIGLLVYSHILGNIFWTRLVSYKFIRNISGPKNSISSVILLTSCVLLSALTVKYIDQILQFLIGHTTK